MRVNRKGLTIIYIGDGKGKTSAVVGLAVRAAGAGKQVLFCQFVKAREATESGEWPPSSEIRILSAIENITVEILGKGFVGILGDQKAHKDHTDTAIEGLAWLVRQIKSDKYDVVIADELISALELQLLTISDILEVIKLAKDHAEAFALTGHTKYNELLDSADVVTEMKMLKHPYYEGILAKRGIDF